MRDFKTHSLTFQSPSKVGRCVLTLYVLSDGYLGLDQQYDLPVEIIQSENSQNIEEDGLIKKFLPPPPGFNAAFDSKESSPINDISADDGYEIMNSATEKNSDDEIPTYSEKSKEQRQRNRKKRDQKRNKNNWADNNDEW